MSTKSELLEQKVLDCVDDDIAESCRNLGNGCWPLALPLQMHIARYLKQLCEIKDFTIGKKN